MAAKTIINLFALFLCLIEEAKERQAKQRFGGLLCMGCSFDLHLGFDVVHALVLLAQQVHRDQEGLAG